MLTFKKAEFVAHPSADLAGDSSLGNRLFMIASTIGIAVKNGYDYGFPEWQNQRFFTNHLPVCEEEFPEFNIDWGFRGFDVSDNHTIYGYLQSPKYFEHCIDLIRHYLIPMYQAEPIKDAILIHYRAYYELLYGTLFAELSKDYYYEALSKFPKMPVIVVTDNIPRARQSLGNEFAYISNTAIQDFYLLTQADYLIGSNSSFSAMAALLGGMPAIFPNKWFANGQSAEDIYFKDWIRL